MEHDDELVQAHQRLLDSVAKRFNDASPAERKKMKASLTLTRSKAISSVGGLRSLFPGLKRLSVTEEGKKNG